MTMGLILSMGIRSTIAKIHVHMFRHGAAASWHYGGTHPRYYSNVIVTPPVRSRSFLQPGEMGDAMVAVDLGTGRHPVAVTAGRWHTCVLLDNEDVKVKRRPLVSVGCLRFTGFFCWRDLVCALSGLDNLVCEVGK